jgi:hypothetical protein
MLNSIPMKHYRLISFLFPLFFLSAAAQSDTSHLRISLLTCSPGAELYSTFGHTAIRVTDSTRGIDMVYNYGTFDYEDPAFLMKFTRGIMEYALSNYSFQDFLQEYQFEKRSVIEQDLQLTGNQKQQLYTALQQNALPQNRYYNYYFHTDNCTTRARDMIVQQTGASVVFKKIIPENPPTFRNLIHTYLDKGGQNWSKLGIDLLLGNNLDEKVTNDQAMFLPDYLMKGLDSATADNHSLVTQKQMALSIAPDPPSFTLMRPLFVFSALFIIIGLLSFSTQKWTQRFLNVFDSIFFLLLGLIGVVIITLWAIRIDTVCRDNFNAGWALPTHLPVAFVVYLKRKWLQQYFKVVFVLTLLFGICWWFIPQQINTAVAPLLGIIAMRSYFRGNLRMKKWTPKHTTNISHSPKTINMEL